MTYTSYASLPPQVRKAFTVEDAEEWMSLYNQRYEELVDGNFESEGENEDILTDTERVYKSYYYAWYNMKEAPSSRSFTAQVAVEDVDDQGEVPLLDKYESLSVNDIIMDGGIGVDRHTSLNVWCVWDVVLGKDNKDRKALIIQGNFFRDKPVFDIYWEMFLEGRSQFSLGTHTNREVRCDSNICRLYAIPNQWYEISIVNIGASPNTGVIEVHVPEGEGEYVPKNHIEGSKYTIKETQGSNINQFCAIEYAYTGMKEELLSTFEVGMCDTTWVCTYDIEEGEDCPKGRRGFILYFEADLREDAMEIVDRWCEDIFVYTQPLPLEEQPDDESTLFLYVIGYPTADEIPLTTDNIVELIIDEEEAITLYDISIAKTKKLNQEGVEDYVKLLEHIRDEEVEHIEELKTLLYAMVVGDTTPLEEYTAYEESGISLKDRQGHYDNARICPAGQHSHIGIEGCHDVTQTHALDIQMIREGLVDISNEDIDIDAIKDAPTSVLKTMVLRISKVVSQYSRQEAMRFMSSSMGKEFALMLTELVDRREKEKRKKRRELKVSDDMTKETKKGSISTKGALDPASDMQSFVTLLAGIQSSIDHLTQTVVELKSSNMSGGEQPGNIADAVAGAVESVGTTEGVDEIEDGEDESITESEGEEVPEEPIPEPEGKPDEEDKKESSEEGDEGEGEGDEDEEEELEEVKKSEEEEGEEDEEPKGKETEGDEDGEEGEEGEEGGKSGGKDDEGKFGKKTKSVSSKSLRAKGEISEKSGTEIPSKDVPSKVNANVNSGGTADLIPNTVVGDEPVVEVTEAKLPSASGSGESGISNKEGFVADGQGGGTRTTPPGVSEGPVGKHLRSISENSIPIGYRESKPYELSDWVNYGKGLMGGATVGDGEAESVVPETTAGVKTTEGGLYEIPPEGVVEGTGLKQSESGTKKVTHNDRWAALGTMEYYEITDKVIR